MSNLFLILFILIIIIIGNLKKVNCYNSFVKGIKESSNVLLNMFSFMLTFSIVTSLIDTSGILAFISKSLKIKNAEILIQMIVRPLSSSSSMTIMLNIFEKYGIDSQIGIISSIIHYISDSTFYIITFYFSMILCKETKKGIILGLTINLLSYILVTIIVYLFY